MAQEIESFFGVYLLYCTNPRYKGRTYIGFTVDPNRRIKQHNTGKHAGGAWRTHGRGPWDMVMIVHGFPNNISALRFEWAWQNPNKSRRLHHVTGKGKKETPFQYRVRVVCEMLRANPWTRLPLTIRWLKQEYITEFDPSCIPPPHMPIAYGPIKPVKVTSQTALLTAEATQSSVQCAVCKQLVKMEETDILKCLQKSCSMTAHVLCLARLFLRNDKLSGCCGAPPPFIPIDGRCPVCKTSMLWGDLIRAKNGCYQNLNDADDDDDDHWARELNTQNL